MKRAPALFACAALALTFTGGSAAHAVDLDAKKTYTKVKLLRIICIRPSERRGDEVYLNIRGRTVWGPEDMKKGTTHRINQTYDLGHNGLHIKLYEDDWVKDDLLDDEKIPKVIKGSGVKELSFDNLSFGQLSFYTIEYKGVK